LGVYDDHDFGWNNGNSRMPHEDLFKSMYLDAIGESQSSPRRGAGRGAWGKYTFNNGDAAVDVFLLDERFDRDPLPCDTRRAYCEDVVLPDTTGAYRHDRAFCEDFLGGGCCDKDETIFLGWCRKPESVTSPLWREACDVSYALFGQRPLALNPTTGDLEVVGPGIRQGQGGTGSSSGDTQQASHFCDVLGRTQRRWLRAAVATSTAAVKVFVSSSVLLANPVPTKCGTRARQTTKAGEKENTRESAVGAASGLDSVLVEAASNAGVRFELMQRLGPNVSHAAAVGGGGEDNDDTEPVYCRCGGDDLDCYTTAQQELLYLIAGPGSTGCNVVVTGDFHFSDVKLLRPGTPGADAYTALPHPVTGEAPFTLVRPVPQIMASGLTISTGSDVPCAGFALDPLALRTHAECAFVRGPSYGRLVFEYEAPTATAAAAAAAATGGGDDGFEHDGERAAKAAACAGNAPVTASCAAAIKSIALQILGGTTKEDIRLETVLDVKTCSTPL